MWRRFGSNASRSDAQRTRWRKLSQPSTGVVQAFLEMMAAERGAAKNTHDAYRRDLSDYAGWLAHRRKTPLIMGLLPGHGVMLGYSKSF